MNKCQRPIYYTFIFIPSIPAAIARVGSMRQTRVSLGARNMNLSRDASHYKWIISTASTAWDLHLPNSLNITQDKGFLAKGAPTKIMHHAQLSIKTQTNEGELSMSEAEICQIWRLFGMWSAPDGKCMQMMYKSKMGSEGLEGRVK